MAGIAGSRDFFREFLEHCVCENKQHRSSYGKNQKCRCPGQNPGRLTVLCAYNPDSGDDGVGKDSYDSKEYSQEEWDARRVAE